MLLWLALILTFGSFQQAVAEEPPVEERGREIYLSYGCAVCHGKNGEGNGINAKNFNPAPTNFHDLKDYRQGTDKDSIHRSIKYGIKEESNIMPAFKDIDEKDIEKLVNFLVSLQKKEEIN